MGMPEGAAYPVARRGNGDESRQARKERGKVLKGKGEEVGGIVKKEMEWAIEVTEERLKVLKEAVVGEAGGSEKGRVDIDKGIEKEAEDSKSDL